MRSTLSFYSLNLDARGGGRLSEHKMSASIKQGHGHGHCFLDSHTCANSSSVAVITAAPAAVPARAKWCCGSHQRSYAYCPDTGLQLFRLMSVLAQFYPELSSLKEPQPQAARAREQRNGSIPAQTGDTKKLSPKKSKADSHAVDSSCTRCCTADRKKDVPHVARRNAHYKV